MKTSLLSHASKIPVEAAEGRVRDRAREIRSGLRLHKIPDRIVVADLAGQLDRHVGGDWWAVVMFADGRGASFGRSRATASPGGWAEEWMAKAAVALNRDLHEDGHWVMAWSREGFPVALWRDGDGDLQTAWEIAPERGPATEKFLASLDKPWLLDQAHRALRETVANLAMLALGRGQTVRKAQGENPREAARKV